MEHSPTLDAPVDRPADSPADRSVDSPDGGPAPAPGAAAVPVATADPGRSPTAGTPAAARGIPQMPGEIGGPRGPEPTRYGDWEVKGRCSDF